MKLLAAQDARLQRNGSEFRLERKRSKRDLEFSRSLLELDENYVMNSGETRTVAEDLFDGHGYLRIDNTDLSAHEVSAQIAEQFRLPTI